MDSGEVTAHEDSDTDSEHSKLEYMLAGVKMKDKYIDADGHIKEMGPFEELISDDRIPDSGKGDKSPEILTDQVKDIG
jgi:hypothetical protein